MFGACAFGECAFTEAPTIATGSGTPSDSIGSRITGGTFSRRRWRDLQEKIEAQARAALERKRRLEAQEQAAKARAEQEAKEAAAQARRVARLALAAKGKTEREANRATGALSATATAERLAACGFDVRQQQHVG